MNTDDLKALRFICAGLLFFFLVSLGVYIISFHTALAIGYQPALSSPPLVVSSWRGEVEYGSVTVTGLVVNNTASAWRGLQVRVACYDRHQNLVGYAYDWLPYLPAGERWSFRAAGTGMPTAHHVTRPELNLR